MLKWLGVKAYRLSISWPRVFPDGTCTPNEKGIGYYERVLEALHSAGIEPYVTLFHWDLPQALEDRFGGVAVAGDIEGIRGVRDIRGEAPE